MQAVRPSSAGPAVTEAGTVSPSEGSTASCSEVFAGGSRPDASAPADLEKLACGSKSADCASGAVAVDVAAAAATDPLTSQPLVPPRGNCALASQVEEEYDDTVPPELSPSLQSTRVVRQLPEGQLDEFLWTPAPTSHAIRRRAILKKYPEIEQLYGHDRWQSILGFAVILAQYFLAYYVGRCRQVSGVGGWIRFAFLCFTVSATLNHSLFAGLHEASHRTVFPGKLSTELFCIALTLPMGLPAAIPFKRYHLDHHIYMGVDVMDPDLPTHWEARFFNSTFRKCLWMLMLPFTYSLRPMIVRPKRVIRMDYVAWAMNGASDLLVLYFCGPVGMLWFLLGTFFSMSVHPFAGHFLAEHFVFPDKDIYQETSSYYGPWNSITYNVGYHNEHHDFPRIPGSRLPLLRRIAPEFYDMKCHTGWGSVTWEFVTSPNITPFNRIKRVCMKGGEITDPRRRKNVLHDGVYPGGGGYGDFWPAIASLGDPAVKKG